MPAPPVLGAGAVGAGSVAGGAVVVGAGAVGAVGAGAGRALTIVTVDVLDAASCGGGAVAASGSGEGSYFSAAWSRSSSSLPAAIASCVAA